MRIRFTPQARFDLDGIFRCLEQYNGTAAVAMKDMIDDRIARLADFPNMGPDTDELGVRELVIVRYPYKIYYEVQSDEVWILHIRDERREPLNG